MWEAEAEKELREKVMTFYEMLNGVKDTNVSAEEIYNSYCQLFDITEDVKQELAR